MLSIAVTYHKYLKYRKTMYYTHHKVLIERRYNVINNKIFNRPTNNGTMRADHVSRFHPVCTQQWPKG